MQGKVKKVFICPGHGGNDRANRGQAGFIEADGVLDISLRLGKLLLEKGFRVKLSREIDKTVSIDDRAKMANLWGADIFISEHTNAGSKKARGTEIIYQLNNPESKRLAEFAYTELVKLGLPKRPTPIYTRESERFPGKDYYGVLRGCKMPAVIIESAFHENPEDEKLLKNPAFRQQIAEAQAGGILNYFGGENQKVNEDAIVVSFKEKELEGFVREGKSFVEVKEFCKLQGLSVSWNQEKRTVVVSS